MAENENLSTRDIICKSAILWTFYNFSKLSIMPSFRKSHLDPIEWNESKCRKRKDYEHQTKVTNLFQDFWWGENRPSIKSHAEIENIPIMNVEINVVFTYEVLVPTLVQNFTCSLHDWAKCLFQTPMEWGCTILFCSNSEYFFGIYFVFMYIIINSK